MSLLRRKPAAAVVEDPQWVLPGTALTFTDKYATGGKTNGVLVAVRVHPEESTDQGREIQAVLAAVPGEPGDDMYVVFYAPLPEDAANWQPYYAQYVTTFEDAYAQYED